MFEISLILGILGVISSLFMPYFPILLGGLAITFAGISMNKKNKGTSGLVLGILTIVFTCFTTFSYNTRTNNTNVAQNSNEITTSSEEVQEIPEGEGDIEKYHLKIEDCQITTDYSGDPILLVKIAFTNNSEESKAFTYPIEDKAFQDGVEITSPISSYGISNYDWKDSTKEIQPGVTYEFNLAYELSNTQSDVTLELSKRYSKNSSKVTKTFHIAE